VQEQVQQKEGIENLVYQIPCIDCRSWVSRIMLGDRVTADAETKLNTDYDIVNNLIRKMIDAVFTLASDSNVLWHHSCVIKRILENVRLVISLTWRFV